MSRTVSTNYTAAGNAFPKANADSDPFDREDVTVLAQAVDDHNHDATKGLPAARVEAAAGKLLVVQGTSAAPAAGRTSLEADATDLYIWPTGAGARLRILRAAEGILLSTVDAAGDLIVGSADNTVARLAVGSPGQSLAVNSSSMPAYADMMHPNPIASADFNLWPWGTSFAAAANDTAIVPRWRYYTSGTTGVVTVSRSTDVPTVGTSRPLQNYSLKVDCTTADAAVAPGDHAMLQVTISGYDFLPYAQRSFILGFWVKSTKTGIFPVACTNISGDRTVVMEYTISSTDTWEYKTVVIPASPSAGTWSYTSEVGLRVTWPIMAGATWHTTAGSWTGGNFYATVNCVNGLDSTDNNFLLSQPRITLGTTALPFAPLPHEFERIRSMPIQTGYAFGVSGSPTVAASGSLTTIPDMTVTMTTHGGDLICLFTGSFYSDYLGAISPFSIVRDGGVAHGGATMMLNTVSAWTPVSISGYLTDVSPGSHTIEAQWSTNAGNLQNYVTYRQLVVLEVPANAS